MKRFLRIPVCVPCAYYFSHLRAVARLIELSYECGLIVGEHTAECQIGGPHDANKRNLVLKNDDLVVKHLSARIIVKNEKRRFREALLQIRQGIMSRDTVVDTNNKFQYSAPIIVSLKVGFDVTKSPLVDKSHEELDVRIRLPLTDKEFINFFPDGVMSGLLIKNA